MFGRPCRSIGIGGSVPFMGLLGRLYPQAQFVVTGALGADSNMHVPDEWLNIGFASRSPRPSRTSSTRTRVADVIRPVPPLPLELHHRYSPAVIAAIDPLPRLNRQWR